MVKVLWFPDYIYEIALENEEFWFALGFRGKAHLIADAALMDC